MRYNNLEKFLNSIKEGKLCTGCVITLADPIVTEAAAESGFDFCWIDGEHGIIDRAAAAQHIMALRGSDCAPFYRVPSCDHTEIKKIIDLAPAGIIVPMIMSENDARYAVECCRYPLQGTRGCGFLRGNAYGTIPMSEYWKQSQKEPLVILQIEHIEAVRNLDAILSVEGVDSCLIGPYDLTASMGHPGEWQHPEVMQTLKEICIKVRASGKLLGAYANTPELKWLDEYLHYAGRTTDLGAMQQGWKSLNIPKIQDC